MTYLHRNLSNLENKIRTSRFVDSIETLLEVCAVNPHKEAWTAAKGDTTSRLALCESLDRRRKWNVEALLPITYCNRWCWVVRPGGCHAGGKMRLVSRSGMFRQLPGFGSMLKRAQSWSLTLPLWPLFLLAIQEERIEAAPCHFLLLLDCLPKWWW